MAYNEELAKRIRDVIGVGEKYECDIPVFVETPIILRGTHFALHLQRTRLRTPKERLSCSG